PVDYSVNPNGQVSPDVTARGIVINIRIGRQSQQCTGVGSCSITVGFPSSAESARVVPASATWVNGRLNLNFLAEALSKTNLLTIDEEIVLDSATARALGYEQLSIRPGQYPVDYSVNPNGQVSPDVTARGIVINIRIGRPNLGCTGIGICSITIGFPSSAESARVVPASATWVNGRLNLNFLSEAVNKTNLLTIDEEIVLDSATARALGYEQLSIRPGQYPVDYSVNPNGQVSPDVTARGIVINIRIGRQSQGCTGVGICSITIGFPSSAESARVVPASATWVNGRLNLNFLAEA